MHNTSRIENVVEASISSVWRHLDLASFIGKNIYITGGTGFFGFWLLAALSRINSKTVETKVTILSRDPSAFLATNPQWCNLPWLSFIAGNVRDFTFPTGTYDYIIHAATDTSSAAHANPATLFDDIVLGTKRIYEFARAAGVKRVLLISSGAVYGPQPADLTHIPDNANFACSTGIASSAYGEGKRVMELLGSINYQQYGIESVVARCFAFVGPGLPLDGHFAIGNFIRDALYADAITVKGDGTAVRSYLYGADLAIWLLQILTQGKNGEAYNVGSDESISIGELAVLVRDLLAPEKSVKIEGLSTNDNLVRNQYVPNIQMARDILGLEVWTGLDESVCQTAHFHECFNGVSIMQ
jgi:nucleoside-diphosphate-sugar epimerase